jgi:hypothetical protein
VALNLSSEQRQVVQTALGRARRRGASPRVTKALLLALGVESNYRDLPYGDRDSVGALQQRPSAGWGPASESLATDVDQFLDRAIPANRRAQGSAGQLAQAVQRSAFPDRYDARSSEAEAILRRFGGGGVAPSSSGGGSPLAGVAQAPDQSGGQQLAAVLSSLQASQPQQRPSMGVAPPAISAGPVMPQGAQQVVSSGGAREESPGAALAAAITAVKGLGAEAGPGERSAEDGIPAPRDGTPGSSSGGAAAAVSFARSRIGQYRETGGANRGPQLDRLQSLLGFKGAPWCAIFTSVAVTRGGAPKAARTASVAEVRRQAMEGGGGYLRGFQSRARAGDLVLFGNDHIGLVESVDRDGTLHTIEGNTGQGEVARRRRAAGSGDIVRPRYGARGR